MGQITFILGGARSGKSTFAERLATKRGGNVLFLATAEPEDPEMVTRINKHQKQRPESWRTLELPRRMGATLLENPPNEDLILLDCITLLVSNVILDACGSIDEPDEQASQQAVEEEIELLLEVIQDGPSDWILVSNEVGLGLVPPYPLGRVYRDLLGWTNRKISSASAEIYFLISGRVLPLHQFSEEMDDFLSKS